MKVRDINEISKGLQALMEVEMSGVTKFKIARNQRVVDAIIDDAIRATSGGTKQDTMEVMEKEVSAELEYIYEDELLDLEIKPSVIYFLSKIIKRRSGGEEEKCESISE